MSSQPAEEWDEMSEQRQNEIKWQARILAEIRDSTVDVEASIRRQRLISASRSGLPARGL